VVITVDGTTVISESVSELADVHEGALEAALKTDPELLKI
jgi:hypothetical protein